MVHSRMDNKKRLPARFFETDKGNIPVREWLLSLSPEDRKLIGDDIRTTEFGWPVGMKTPVQDLNLAGKRMRGMK